MPARRSKEPIADLFSKSGVKAPRKSPPIMPSIPAAKAGSAPEARLLLPKDLLGALRHLDDAEIDSLLAAVIKEARRRGRLPAGLSTALKKSEALPCGLSQRKTRKKPVTPRPMKSKTDERDVLLKQGQINAVRAAFKAGVKPSIIARKFGIPRSLVRKAISEGARPNKP